MPRPFPPGACAVGAVVLLAVATPAAPAQQCDSTVGRPLDVAGMVIDARALAPVRATLIFTAGRDTLARLDADSTGFFTVLLCRRARIVAHFRRLGYRADSLVVPLDTTRWTALDVAMSPTDEGVTLAASRITAPRPIVAIEQRAKRAGGVFIGAAEIERRNASRTSDLLRGRRGIAIENDGGSEVRIVSSRGFRQPGDDEVRSLPPQLARRARSDTASAGSAVEPSRVFHGGREACTLRIGVNGYVMPVGYSPNDVPTADLVAIEVYSGAAQMPVELLSSRRELNCGLVMIWTRGIGVEG